MVPSTDIDPFEKNEDELRADKAKLEELRGSYNFTALTDLQRVCLVYDSRMENHKPEQERYAYSLGTFAQSFCLLGANT